MISSKEEEFINRFGELPKSLTPQQAYEIREFQKTAQDYNTFTKYFGFVVATAIIYATYQNIQETIESLKFQDNIVYATGAASVLFMQEPETIGIERTALKDEMKRYNPLGFDIYNYDLKVYIWKAFQRLGINDKLYDIAKNDTDKTATIFDKALNLIKVPFVRYYKENLVPIHEKFSKLDFSYKYISREDTPEKMAEAYAQTLSQTENKNVDLEFEKFKIKMAEFVRTHNKTNSSEIAAIVSSIETKDKNVNSIDNIIKTIEFSSEEDLK